MSSHRPAILGRSLCYAYDAEDVLHDVTVHLAFGEVAAVAGPNGSGKSTLVEILAGVLRPRSGAVTRAGDVALVVQRPDAPPSLPVTVRDAVAMGTWAGGRRMPRARARTAVAEAIARVELTGYEDRPLSALSGGQRQRALLAQGIVRRPSILLLDEPAAGLDSRSRDRTRTILAEEARRGAAVACVTHDETSMAVADRVIRIEAGRLQASA
ncbi:zinc ABC transporter ATP-binding protein AztA [Microbacterium oryzae]|uniref:zinc ABC transporter ATP-binding protein AztA n=1 Tax=Microbacterium oryzae TaxID=743009 RepID=UPI0025AF32D7|nr:zinc ABC transporter ATP-binding protein AztA [Microbacterium oryzae]MDN3311250.1 zinc ABC transporter ATP-binding protein AztA [Microbacterium oryzae]